MRRSTKSRVGLALLCALALGLLMAGTAGAETTGETADGFMYSIEGDAATITGYMGTGTAISIPANVEGVAVRTIGYSAFQDKTSLQGVFIPSSVRTIGENAFRDCGSLTSLNIQSGVTSIMKSAFEGCSRLTSVTIPSGVTSIGNWAFADCNGLTSLTISSGVISIGEAAFAGCRSLTSVSIPSGVTSIGNQAFSSCSSLTSVTIPSGVTSIGWNAFTNCTSLTSVNIPSGLTSIASGTFGNCSSLTMLTIPSGVSSIGVWAFQGCSSLTSVTIPSGVTSIGDYAFDKCSSLTSVNIPLGVASIESSVFSACSNLKSVNIPSGVTSIGDNAFNGCSSLTSVNIPSGVTSIGESAFEGCSSLTSVNIPSGVTSIGNHAFRFTTITLRVYPGSVAETYAKTYSIPYELLTINNVISITLNKSSLLMSPGEIASITAGFFPDDATIKAVNWTSSNTAVAMVTTDGQVMAVGLGSATITATAKDGGGASAICSVNVTQPVTSITIEPVSVALDTGGTRQLTATVSPDNASDESIQWSSGNTSVVTVDDNGLVTAIAPGTTTITATALDGSGVSGSAEITVNKLQYDMSGVAWNYSGALTYDGSPKTVLLTGLPESITPEYIGNTATNAGSYTANVILTSQDANYENPVMPDLPWIIKPVADPVLRGDATSDGNVDILDLVSIIDYIVSNTSPASPANADANGDGAVDIMDLVWIIDEIVGG